MVDIQQLLCPQKCVHWCQCRRCSAVQRVGYISIPKWFTAKHLSCKCRYSVISRQNASFEQGMYGNMHLCEFQHLKLVINGLHKVVSYVFKSCATQLSLKKTSSEKKKKNFCVILFRIRCKYFERGSLITFIM